MKLLGISPEEKVNFTRGLSLMLKSGVSIDKSLDLLENQTKSKDLKKLIQKARNSVLKGSPFYKVFEESKDFRGVFSSFIKSGEGSGTLEENLEFLADWLENNSDLQRDIGSAVLYPKIILTVALVMGGGVTVFVLPNLIPMFQDLDIDLPLTTRILLAISDVTENYGLLVFLGLIGLYVGFKLLMNIRVIKKIFDNIFLKIPLFGRLMSDYQLAFFSQVLYVLIRSGMPIRSSIEIASESLSNLVYQESMIKVGEGIRKGNPISEELEKFPKLYPGILCGIVATGESTGNLEGSMKYLSSFYTKRIKKKTADLPTLIEPFLLVIIGLFVALLGSAIIMPIYEITKGLDV